MSVPSHSEGGGPGREDAGPRQVLVQVVTAEPALRRRLTELFEGRGWSVASGGTGATGGIGATGAELPSLEPDLTVLDTALAGVDAPTVVRRLLAAGSAAPILVVAAREDAEAALAAIQAGAADVLFKPLDPLSLPARAERLLLQRRVAALEERRTTLEFRNQELESFIYIVTHDMKTPVVNLQGLASLIQEDHGGSLPKQVQDYLERLRRNAERLEELLRDLLAYPKELSLLGPVEPHGLNQVVEAAIDGLRENAAAARVELVVQRDMPQVACDPRRVQQVFHNLIENGIKHARAVAEPRVEVAATQASGGLRCSVKDNGPGIPEDQLQDVFRLFHRLPGTKTPGTGIGLAVARHLVEAHGGEIWCESRQGQGTTFSFTLPSR